METRGQETRGQERVKKLAGGSALSCERLWVAYPLPFGFFLQRVGAFSDSFHLALISVPSIVYIFQNPARQYSSLSCPFYY
jgi:hypothetical protein